MDRLCASLLWLTDMAQSQPFLLEIRNDGQVASKAAGLRLACHRFAGLLPLDGDEPDAFGTFSVDSG